jgi:hypothetical protein
MATDLKLDLPRRLPMALLVTLLMQVASVLIWATQLDARVNNIEQLCTNNSGLNEKFARLDERLDGMKHQLDRLTDKLLK